MKPEADIIERITKSAIAESVARWPDSSGYAYACGLLQGEMLDILRSVPEAMKYFLDKNKPETKPEQQ